MKVVVVILCYAESRYAKCRYAECHGAKGGVRKPTSNPNFITFFHQMELTGIE